MRRDEERNPWTEETLARPRSGLPDSDHEGPGSRRARPVTEGWWRRARADYWSLLFGEIAVCTFVVLTVTGVYLAVFFDPSMNRVPYDGARQLDDPRGRKLGRTLATRYRHRSAGQRENLHT